MSHKKKPETVRAGGSREVKPPRPGTPAPAKDDKQKKEVKDHGDAD